MALLDKVLLSIEREGFEVRFVGRHDWDGSLDWAEKRINISIYSSIPVSVLIHETLHWLYPRLKEENVLTLEATLYAQLSEEQKKWLEKILWEAMRKYRKTHPKTAHRTRNRREKWTC